ncbi:hypothetical protein D9619_007632 [Psilocybe cf. subviscida]|uniref:Uncharacterized protein n=1 Tax=Psilocybe cf. subviscida TaxID=2480587 RepID=A0A8H5AUC3_9AGAR|nr:hypothetical protein D9619_007632 [Psilocybe cf. subviscida]
MSAYDGLPIYMETNFNGVIAQAMFSGMYTLLFVQALWKLQRKGGKRVYSCALILLWMSAIVNWGESWVMASSGFVDHNGSRVAIVTALFDYANLPKAVDIIGLTTFPIADAILIWRCNVLWHNPYILFVLVVLNTVTAALVVASPLLQNEQTSRITNLLVTLFSFIITVSATCLVILKIVLITRRSHMRHSYAKIIEILVQSAALVSIVVVGSAIPEAYNIIQPFALGTTTGNVLYRMDQYTSYILCPVLGIGPTLIAFRVAKEPSKTLINATKGAMLLSRLIFQRTARNTSSDGETTEFRVGSGHPPDKPGSDQHHSDVEGRENIAPAQENTIVETMGIAGAEFV